MPTKIMSELVIDVSKHTRNNRIAYLLFFISMMLSFALSFKINADSIGKLLAIPMTFFIFIILAYIFDQFINENKTPEATLTITTGGIHLLKANGRTQSFKWRELACVNIFDHGPVRSLRIAPAKFASREILYEEKHLSHSCQDIIKFVHDVSPYGKDISFWNEKRTKPQPPSSPHLVG